MTIGSIIGGGVQLLRTHPRTVASWAALYAVLTIALRPPTILMIAAQQQRIDAAAASGVPATPAFTPAAGLAILALYVVGFLSLAAAFAAVVRAAASTVEDRFAFLRLGMDELRLIGLGILLVIAGIVADLAAIIVTAIVVAVIQTAVGMTATMVVAAILGLALLCTLIWAEVRMSLAGAFTVMRRRIIIGDGWRATRGHFWTLVGTFVVFSIVYFVLFIVVIAITNPELMSAYASRNMQAIVAASQNQPAFQASRSLLAVIVEALFSAIVFVPLGVVALGGIASAAIEANRDLAPTEDFR